MTYYEERSFMAIKIEQVVTQLTQPDVALPQKALERVDRSVVMGENEGPTLSSLLSNSRAFYAETKPIPEDQGGQMVFGLVLLYCEERNRAEQKKLGAYLVRICEQLQQETVFAKMSSLSIMKQLIQWSSHD
jgi:hypothetical protein